MHMVYIKAEEASFIRHHLVRIGDVAAVYCRDQEMEDRINKLLLYTFDQEREDRAFVSVLWLVRVIEKACPGVKIKSLGAKDLVISYRPQDQVPPDWQVWLKILLICITCFLGSGVAIMEYNNDVDISKVFAQLYETFIGVRPAGPTFIEFFYSIGLTIGVFLFFNHIPGSRITDEPTPIQVQMRLYEKNVNQTMLRNAAGKGGELESGRRGEEKKTDCGIRDKEEEPD